MARFVRGEPVLTREPFVTVDAGLAPGPHRFQLEVVTDDRRVSGPDTVVVEVSDRGIVGPADPLDPLRRDPLRPDDRLRPDPLRPDSE